MLMVQSRQAAMGEMICNIAHQWRQPLNRLGLIIKDFEEAYEFGEMNKEYLEKQVQKGMDLIRYLSETIDDFRNFFKPSKEENKFSVKKAIEKTITLVENSFEHYNIKIDFTVEQDVWVTGQPNQFSQVIINILNNSKDAFKNSESKSPLVKIHLSKEGKKAKLIIKDNAGGIPNKIIDKIFESYFITKEGNEGTGLGLFISKTIIEKNMKGKISVRNQKDGAEFIIFM